MVPNVIPKPFAGMGKLSQWVVWRLIPDPHGGKDRKVPMDPASGLPINPHDPANQMSYEAAALAANAWGVGVGFVFTDGDPYFFVDVDNGRLPNGDWSELAKQVFAMFPGATFEVSQSGKGFHIFGRYSQVIPHSNKRTDLDLELYVTARFCAITFTDAMGADTLQDEGYGHYSSWFPPKDYADTVEMLDQAVDGYTATEDDDALILKMLKERPSLQAMQGTVATTRQLWEGDADALSKFYPQKNEHNPEPFDHSSADIALCKKLAFYTGKNPARIERLFRTSGLMREKWNERPAWVQETISRGIGFCDAFYTEGRAPATPPSAIDIDAAPASAVALQYLAPDQQLGYFAGCVYVGDRHRVLGPNGIFYTPAAFKTTYGGYIFAMDYDNDKVATNAFEAFTESRALRWPKVNTTTFRPEDPAGTLYNEGGLTMVNSYVPIAVPSIPGDVSPFLNLLAKMIPHDGDRAGIIAYMASAVQNFGVKFQWAPCIQGVQGNGKSFLLKVMCMAVGKRYYHLPKANALTSDFNAWIEGKVFIGVEEIRMVGRPDLEDALKDMITASEIEIQAKGVDQVTGENRANFMFCSNHKDAVIKSATDRRWAPYFTAQQSLEDLERDGMGGDYFPNLYNWLLNENGSAHINHFLQNYEIPAALDPAGEQHRAPITTSTLEAMALSVPKAQQIIAELIESGAMGCRGGWLSMTYLTIAFERVRGCDRKQIKAGIEALDYIAHPGLRDGRATSPIPNEDNKKPRLYVRRDSLQCNLIGMAVQAAYLKAQELPPPQQGKLFGNVQ